MIKEGNNDDLRQLITGVINGPKATVRIASALPRFPLPFVNVRRFNRTSSARASGGSKSRKKEIAWHHSSPAA